jgi:hypothetical protein
MPLPPPPASAPSRKTLARFLHGAFSPAAAFGADFAITIPRTTRVNTIPAEAPVRRALKARLESASCLLSQEGSNTGSASYLGLHRQCVTDARRAGPSARRSA